MKSIDLFAGAGGLSCGLEMAGFQPILANELVEIHAQTYQKNNPNTNVIVGDVRKVCDVDLKRKLGLKSGELDLLAGGPPCQGFSVNAPIRDLDDERNHLFKDFLRVAYGLLPKAILIENVPGIVSLGKGTVVEQILRELKKMNYSVAYKILYAGHYGIPQTRYRTIFLAVRGDIDITFPKPLYNSTAVANFTGARELCLKLEDEELRSLPQATTVDDAISDLPPIESGSRNPPMGYAKKEKGWYQKELRKNSSLIHNHDCSGLGKINLQRLEHIPQGGNWTNIPFDLLPKGMQRARRSDHTKRYGRLHPDGLCSTILTKCDPHWGAFIHPEQDRVLSIREAARIQSFPDTFRFYGSLAQQYEQVGNAVPPLMAKEIGNQIAKYIG